MFILYIVYCLSCHESYVMAFSISFWDCFDQIYVQFISCHDLLPHASVVLVTTTVQRLCMYILFVLSAVSRWTRIMHSVSSNRRDGNEAANNELHMYQIYKPTSSQPNCRLIIQTSRNQSRYVHPATFRVLQDAFYTENNRNKNQSTISNVSCCARFVT